ncbi:DUF4361 domain-containing protein [Pedobacter sp. MC2016-24]|nr:DUF4361 domain-containing protein [Pedobacter sp. MC2016-24]
MKFISTMLVALMAILTGCSKEKNPLDEEQFMKQAYLVGSNKSNNEGLSTIKLAYGKSADEEQLSYISVATGGSKNIDRNITATLADAGNASIIRYNFLYRFNGDIKYQMLASSLYRIPEKNVQIKSGDTYGTVPFYIKTAGLHCDSLYAVTVKIASLSDPGYISIRQVDTVLMVSFALTNDYSGNYQAQGKYYKLLNAGPLDTTSIALPRTLKAVNYQTIRFSHLSAGETVATANESGVKVRIADDNSLTITPWGSLVITAGGGTYKPATKVFELWYNYTVSGVTYQFKGKFTRSQA